jgi:hypothetical protein
MMARTRGWRSVYTVCIRFTGKFSIFSSISQTLSVFLYLLTEKKIAVLDPPVCKFVCMLYLDYDKHLHNFSNSHFCVTLADCPLVELIAMFTLAFLV